MIHATQQCSCGLAGLHDLEERDVEAIIDYWHGGGADLAFLGIDLARLGSLDDWDCRLPHRGSGM